MLSCSATMWASTHVSWALLRSASFTRIAGGPRPFWSWSGNCSLTVRQNIDTRISVPIILINILYCGCLVGMHSCLEYCAVLSKAEDKPFPHTITIHPSPCVFVLELPVYQSGLRFLPGWNPTFHSLLSGNLTVIDLLQIRARHHFVSLLVSRVSFSYCCFRY
jgi:hypothetical protein